MASKKAQQLKKQRQIERQKEKARKRQRMVILGSTLAIVVLVIAILIPVLNSTNKNKDETSSTPREVSINYDKQPMLGSKDAPVTVLEFGDYRCIYCKQFNDSVFPKLKKNEIASGKVKFFFLNDTILGPGSKLAANAAEYIYKNYPDSFWDFHEAIYASQGDEKEQWVTKDLLTQLAVKNVDNLDKQAFRKALDNMSAMDAVESDNKVAQKLGFQGTPAVYVNGKLVGSPLDYQAVKKAIEQAADGK